MKRTLYPVLLLLFYGQASGADWVAVKNNFYIDLDSFREVHLHPTGPTVSAWFKLDGELAKINTDKKIAQQRIHLEVFCGQPRYLRELSSYTYDKNGSAVSASSSPQRGISYAVPESVGDIAITAACNSWLALSKAGGLGE